MRYLLLLSRRLSSRKQLSLVPDAHEARNLNEKESKMSEEKQLGGRPDDRKEFFEFLRERNKQKNAENSPENDPVAPVEDIDDGIEDNPHGSSEDE